MKKLSTLFLLLILLGSCKIVNPEIQPEDSNALWIEIKHTGCYGTCPIYNWKVYANGDLQYQAMRFTEFIGVKEASMSDRELFKFYSSLKGYNLIPIDTTHRDRAIDLPSTILRVYSKNTDNYREVKCMGTCSEVYHKKIFKVEDVLFEIMEEQNRQ